MKWFRFYHEFVDDPKIAMMSDSDQLLWVKALCLANDSKVRGIIMLTDEEICWKLRITMEVWKHAIDKFRAKGMIDHHPDGYKITNWDNRQFESDSSAERVRKHREKRVTLQKRECNVTETPSDTDTDTEQIQKTEQNLKPKNKSGSDNTKGQTAIDIYNQYKPDSWASVKKLNDDRKRKLEKLIQDAKELEVPWPSLLQSALEFASSDKWWSETYQGSFESVFQKNRYMEWFEKSDSTDQPSTDLRNQITAQLRRLGRSAVLPLAWQQRTRKQTIGELTPQEMQAYLLELQSEGVKA